MVSRPVRSPMRRPDLPRASSGNIRVLLLRHDGRAGGIGVVKAHEGELLGVPDDDLLRQSADVDAGHGCDEREFGDQITAAVPSMEFAVTLEKPSSRATATGSKPSVLPARAPEPYGLASMRLSQSARRSTSRISGHTWAMSWCASSTGWACCMWVRPGMTVRPAFSACSIRALTRSSRSPAITREWRRNHMRISAGDLVVAGAAGPELASSSSPTICNQTAFRGRWPRPHRLRWGRTHRIVNWRCSSSRASSMRCSSSAVR